MLEKTFLIKWQMLKDIKETYLLMDGLSSSYLELHLDLHDSQIMIGGMTLKTYSASEFLDVDSNIFEAIL